MALDVAAYCLGKLGGVEDYPFGDDVAVFKVSGKMFALVSPPAKPRQVSLKCDPTLAIALRQKYDGVKAGYHLSKVHWNTVDLNLDVPELEIKKQIDQSYNLVVASLPVRDRPK